MDDDKGDYEVGYGKPPKEHQFKPGQSGHVRGRPKTKKPEDIDVGEILNAPVEVMKGGRRVKMQPFEVSFRRLSKRANEGDLRAIVKFITLCEQYGVLAPPPPVTGGGVIHAPKGVTPEEWINSAREDWPPEDTYADPNEREFK